jgi:hypothetical protein
MSSKPYFRNHSFSKPIALAQAASWAIFISEALVFYIYVINGYQDKNFQTVFNVLFSSSFVALVIGAISTGQTDPTDELVIATRKKDL